MGGAEGGNLRLISISSLSHLLRLCLRSRVRVGPPYMCYPAARVHTVTLPSHPFVTPSRSGSLSDHRGRDPVPTLPRRRRDKVPGDHPVHHDESRRDLELARSAPAV